MKNTRGFTLIELMITIAILAIIVGIAVPAYQNQVEKTRRADAIAGLTQAAQQLERCFTRNNSYADCAYQTTSPDDYYLISRASDSAGSTFALTATADETGPQKNDDCSPFTLNHLGAKGAESTTDRCWGQN
ncbi:MAG: type IV pilin protein [Pirellulaceae bacterium]